MGNKLRRDVWSHQKTRLFKPDAAPRGGSSYTYFPLHPQCNGQWQCNAMYYTPLCHYEHLASSPLASARGHLASNFINNFWCKLRLTRPWQGAATGGSSFFIRRCTKQMTLETVISVVCPSRIIYLTLTPHIHYIRMPFNSLTYDIHIRVIQGEKVCCMIVWCM